MLYNKCVKKGGLIMIGNDYYTLLGVERSATAEQIKKAYRTLARKYHTDVNDSLEAEEKIRQINEAYEVLSDPAKRADYDRFGGAGLGNGFVMPDFSGFAAAMPVESVDLDEAFGGDFSRVFR